jgi:hypothetical protein
MCVLRNNEMRSQNIVAVKKQRIIITYLYVYVPARVGVCTHVHAYSLAYPARNAYAPYCDVICDPSGSITFFAIIS